MTTIPLSAPFNAEATLNAWMIAGLQGFTLPSWLTPLPSIVDDWPNLPASLPCFSLVHIPVTSAEMRYQGRNVGGGVKGARATAMLEVSCWVSRKASVNWMAQLRTMRTMVLAICQTNGVPMQDYSLPSVPAATNYKINIDDVNEVAVQADVNPDIERARILIDYSYVLRGS